MTDFRQVCTAALDIKGALRSPWVRDAFHTIDRAHFAPARLWSQIPGDDGLYPVIDAADKDAWQQAVWHPHRSVITQLDDYRLPDAPARGDFTSSISAPDTVCELLCQLDLQPGHRVLEIGTGSGYNAALLCQRVGDHNVTSIEVDPELAAWAHGNLTKAGLHPELVCGDGTEGVPASGPYDRIIATASLRTIPRAWVDQCTEGAVILAPFGTSYATGALARLTVQDGSATGHFSGTASYMWMRSQRPPRDLNPPDGKHKTTAGIDPAQVLRGDWQQDFALGLRVPDLAYTHRGDGDRRQAQLWDQAGTSVTIVNYGHWWEPTAVTRYGPRDLWAEVCAAYTDWRVSGQPDPSRHGLTITTEGQRFWLDTPNGPSWMLPV